ncbi:MAG: amidohydrolase family protein, partial [Clostridia bacterium]|nr:amidohydrolase family protein [Clostridia bacterium]
ALVDVAPEVEGAAEFACYARNLCTVSAAHTASDGYTAENAFQNGFTHATHMYNAMTGFKAREPGVAGAVLENERVTAELICDGFHNNPVTVRASFRCLGENRICVVSDSMCSAGCPDGVYRLGGQNVYVQDGKALLKDGTIAASISNIHEEFLNLLDFGIPFSAALKACTINPARVIAADSFTGSIKNGKYADLTVLDGNMDIKFVIIKGKVVYRK